MGCTILELLQLFRKTAATVAPNNITVIKMWLNYCKLLYSTAQREVTIVSRDASRFSRDASRFSRGESRFSRVHCKYRPKASSSGVFELLCLYTLHESLFWGIVSKVELLGWRGKRSYDFHS